MKNKNLPTVTNESRIDFLRNSFGDITKDSSIPPKEKLKENGFMAADNLLDPLIYVNDPMYAAAIPAMAFGSNDDDIRFVSSQEILLTNTIDEGFRFAAPNINDGGLIDLGPADLVCAVGNVNRPYGFFVPFNQTALQQAHSFISGMLSEGDYADNCNCCNCHNDIRMEW